MKSRAYEQLVAQILRDFECFRGWKVFTNKRYNGIRQPGTYEVDISLETSFGDTADFIFIVECKNWKRPVDRPVVQKLSQTRDAIAAHKAAIASPIGFTLEAIEVAKAHGIAMWIVAEKEWYAVSRSISVFEILLLILQNFLRKRREKFMYLRQGFLDATGVEPEMACREFASPSDQVIIGAQFAEAQGTRENPSSETRMLGLSCQSDIPGVSVPGWDHRLATTQVIDAFAEHHIGQWRAGLWESTCPVCCWREGVSCELTGEGLEPAAINVAIEALVKDDTQSFLTQVRYAWPVLDAWVIRKLKQVGFIRWLLRYW